MKKLLSLLLAVVMILSLCTVAFATDTTPDLPTGSSVAAGPAGVTSFTVNGDRVLSSKTRMSEKTRSLTLLPRM